MSRRWFEFICGPNLLAGLVLGFLLAPSARAEPPFPSNLGLLERLVDQAAREAVDSLRLAPSTRLNIVATRAHEGSDFVMRRLAQALADRGHEVRIHGVLEAPSAGEADGDAPAGETPPANAPAQNGQAKKGSAYKGAGQAQPKKQAPASGGAPADSAAADTVFWQVDPVWGDSIRVNAEGQPIEPSDEPGGGSQEPSDGTNAGSRDRASGPSLPEGDVLDVDVLEFGVNYAEIRRKLLVGPTRFTRVGGAWFQVSHLMGPEGRLLQVVSAERHAVDRLTGGQRVLVEGANYPFTAPNLSPPSLGRYIEPAVVVGIVGSLIYLFYQNQN